MLIITIKSVGNFVLRLFSGNFSWLFELNALNTTLPFCNVPDLCPIIRGFESHDAYENTG